MVSMGANAAKVDDLHTLIDRGWGRLDIGDHRYCLKHNTHQGYHDGRVSLGDNRVGLGDIQ